MLWVGRILVVPPLPVLPNRPTSPHRGDSQVPAQPLRPVSAVSSRSIKAERLAIALAQGRTRSEAALAAGVSDRTVYAWLADPDFRSRVDELRRAVLDESLSVLFASSALASRTLAALLAETVPPTVRLGAARAILADLVALTFHADLEARIRALEGLSHEAS